MHKLLIAKVIAGINFFASSVFAHDPEEGYPMGPWSMWWGHGGYFL